MPLYRRCFSSGHNIGIFGGMNSSIVVYRLALVRPGYTFAAPPENAISQGITQQGGSPYLSSTHS